MYGECPWRRRHVGSPARHENINEDSDYCREEEDWRLEENVLHINFQ